MAVAHSSLWSSFYLVCSSLTPVSECALYMHYGSGSSCKNGLLHLGIPPCLQQGTLDDGGAAPFSLVIDQCSCGYAKHKK